MVLCDVLSRQGASLSEAWKQGWDEEHQRAAEGASLGVLELRLPRGVNQGEEAGGWAEEASAAKRQGETVD